VDKRELKKLFNYVDGKLIHKIDGLRVKAGSVAGWSNGNGYFRVHVNGKHLYVHRVIWCLHYGDPKNNLIDHIDGNRKNNDIKNLRLSDQSKNGLNRHFARSDSSSGLLGVISSKSKKGTPTFQARVIVDKRRFVIGNFKTAQEAHDAYVYAKDEILKGNENVIYTIRTSRNSLE
jgi:hypothetical protein